MAEFTGERVIPGEVEADLLNEHVARYLFAARMARGRRVLDAGCGSGYGAAELAREASDVLGIDVAPDAIDYAREHYSAPRLRFETASCLQIPAADGVFDLVVAFEIIEHLNDWRSFLGEARRVLSPAGQLLVSTPNKVYYAESRAELGPNPFHVHEFEFDEFQHELAEVFPHVTIFLENHSDAIVFAPVSGAENLEARAGSGSANPEEAHFFVAVAGVRKTAAPPGFVYVPRAANVLREREHHIQLLEGWLEKSKADLADLMEQFRRQTGALDESNRWAANLNAQLEERGARVVALQEELAAEQANARANIELIQAQIAQEQEEKLRLLEYLHAAERTVEERTQWAQRNQAEADAERHKVNLYQTSRWVRLGRQLGLGPKLERTK